MANIFLELEANGSTLQGDVAGGQFDDHIEVTSFDWGVITTTGSGGVLAGRRVYREVRIVAPHQKSSVLIWRALALNQLVEGTLKCVRPNPSGDGTEELYLTIHFEQARVSSFTQAQEEGVAMEEISFVFNKLEVTHMNGGITHEDDWSALR